MTALKNYASVIAKLAGSIIPPKLFSKMTIAEMIRMSKELHFSRKHKADIRKGYKEYKSGKAKAIRILLKELK